MEQNYFVEYIKNLERSRKTVENKDDYLSRMAVIEIDTRIRSAKARLKAEKVKTTNVTEYDHNFLAIHGIVHIS